MWIPDTTAQPPPNWAERPLARLVDDPPRPLFHRDLTLFRLLREVVLPRVIERRQSAIRVWLVGCGTGEDAYAVAIELLRSLGDALVPIRIFATDLEQDLIDFARAGLYEEAALQHLDEATRATYLRPVDGRLRVTDQVRRCCVFARLDPGGGGRGLRRQATARAREPARGAARVRRHAAPATGGRQPALERDQVHTSRRQARGLAG